MTELSLTTSRHIAAPPDRVFAAWLDPDLLARFMRPGSDVTVPQARVDARKGGRFSILMRIGGRDLPHEGTYLQIDRPRRLAFTWESHASVDGSTVTLDFAPAGEGGTDLTLHQVKFIDADRRDAHGRGWTAILAALAGALAETEGARA